jgi:hypothetical protein
MAENYNIGVRRVFYRARKFGEGLAVSMDILDPSLNWMVGLSFTEAGGGLYYLDFNFATEGTYAALLFEDGTKAVSQNFHITDEPGGFLISGSTFRGPSVINT